MFYRFGYLFRETGNNLWRNTTLFLATIVAVWISLAMFGSAIIIRDGVGQATGRWSDGIQFIVFMRIDATPDQYEEVSRSIDENPEIELVEFVGQQRAYEELLEEYGDENQPGWSLLRLNPCRRPTECARSAMTQRSSPTSQPVSAANQGAFSTGCA